MSRVSGYTQERSDGSWLAVAESTTLWRSVFRRDPKFRYSWICNSETEAQAIMRRLIKILKTRT